MGWTRVIRLSSMRMLASYLKTRCRDLMVIQRYLVFNDLMIRRKGCDKKRTLGEISIF